MAPGLRGVTEDRVARVVRLVADRVGDIRGMRVLDLGCYEGGFSVALAQHGAEVVAIDARESHVRKAEFAATALGLANMTVLRADVRDLEEHAAGTFDVVLCLGLLYHLPAETAIGLLRTICELCGGFAIVETQIALSGSRSVDLDRRVYRGRPYPENTREPGASVENGESFWLTKSSLLNALADAGFTSVAECLNPVIPALAEYRDHITLIASRGPRLDLPFAAARWPERLRSLAHPAQGLRYAIKERWLARRGDGIVRFFVKSPRGH